MGPDGRCAVARAIRELGPRGRRRQMEMGRNEGLGRASDWAEKPPGSPVRCLSLFLLSFSFSFLPF